MPGAADTTSSKIIESMVRIGPADVKTIADIAGVGRSTANRKLNHWLTGGTVSRIDRGDDPAHWTLARSTTTATGETADAPAVCMDGSPSESPAETSTPGGETETETDGDEEPGQAGPHELAESFPASTSDDATTPVPSDDLGDEPELAAEPAPAQAAPDLPSEPENAATTAIPVTGGPQTPSRKRRENGAIGTMGLAILNANPGNTYTPGELARLAERDEIARGVPEADAKVAAGAMINAMNKAANLGKCVRASDKPARYQAVQP